MKKSKITKIQNDVLNQDYIFVWLLFKSFSSLLFVFNKVFLRLTFFRYFINIGMSFKFFKLLHVRNKTVSQFLIIDP